MKRAVQIATLALALSMLAGFVVYSQQKTGRPRVEQVPATSNEARRAAPAPVLAPGSKSISPVMRRPAPTIATNTIRATPAPPVSRGGAFGGGVNDIVASSSKSAAVFPPQQPIIELPRSPPQVPLPIANPPARSFIHTGQVMYSTKSAPVIPPPSFPIQRSAATPTNAPPRKPAS